MKKLTAIILAAALALVMCAALSACTDRGDVWLNEAEILAEANADGSIDVAETWRAEISSSEPRKNLYKELTFTSSAQREEFIESFSVTAGDGSVVETRRLEYSPEHYANSIYTSSEGVFAYYYVYGSTRLEIGVFFPGITSGEREFTFRYTLPDAVTVYDDCAMIYWSQFSADYSLYIDSYTCRLTLPEGAAMAEDDESTLFWLHINGADESDTAASGNEITFTARGLSYEEGDTPIAEIRVMTGTERFTETAATSGAVRQRVIDEETAWYEAYEEELRRERIWLIAGLVAGIVCVLGAVALAVYFKLFFGKYDKNKYPEYVREIPPGYGAAEMGYFFYHYDGSADSSKNRSRLISATILELARRGIVDIEKPLDDKEDCILKINEVPEAELNDMKGYERAVYNMLSKAQSAAGDKPFTMDEFSDYAKNNDRSVANDVKAFASSASAEYRRGGYTGTDPRNFTYISGFFAFAAAIMLWILLPEAIFLTIGLIVMGAALFIFSPKVAKLNKKGEAKHAEAHALKRYMLEFSNLKEYEIPQLALWEEYMVFATMMGISEEVLKELKASYPELSDPARFAAARPSFGRSYLFTYFALSGLRGGPVFDIGAHIFRSVNAVNNTIRAITASRNLASGVRKIGGGFGRGGGGFRGGGGGSFGGGGGAR